VWRLPQSLQDFGEDEHFRFFFLTEDFAIVATFAAKRSYFFFAEEALSFSDWTIIVHLLVWHFDSSSDYMSGMGATQPSHHHESGEHRVLRPHPGGE